MLGEDDSKCNLYNKSQSNVYHLDNTYGGIPQNLITNLVGWACLLLVFIVLRKSAWKVLNTVVRRDDLRKIERWTTMFFAFSANMITTPVQAVHQRVKSRNELAAAGDQPTPEISTENGESSEILPAPPDTDPEAVTITLVEDEPDDPPTLRNGSPGDTRSRLVRLPSMHRQMSMYEERQTFWEWFKSIFVMKDDEIFCRCGDDAVQYLRYQRHIIVYLIIIMILSICVILPLNFQGQLLGTQASFEHTTLANLEHESPYLWVHITLSFLYFPMAIIVMRRFSRDLKFQDISLLEINNTLMIERIPVPEKKKDRPLDTSKLVKVEELLQYFVECFPECTVTDIRFAYKVDKLTEIDRDLKSAILSKKYCENHKDLTVYPVNCSRCCGCWCCCCVHKEEASEYYTQLVHELSGKFVAAKEAALKHPLPIAFVSFKSVNMAKDVYDVFKRAWYQCSKPNPPVSSVSAKIKPENWRMTFASTPDDIYWDNLSVSKRFLISKYIIINVILFLVAFFLTTPEYLASQSNIVIGFFDKSLKLPTYIVDFLPTLLLWSFTALMPLLVAYSDRWLGHWLRSQENHAIMKKSFWYLLFMVIFLPTFGFTTAGAALDFFLHQNTNQTYRWDCVFLPDSGAFFVNYVITAAMIGTGLELVRFPDLLWYMIQICWSKSEADVPAIRKSIKNEFRFGEQYARMMLMFCMTMMYSVSCPLITPFGLLYFVMKHMVDRHNIIYVYKPSKISKRVHATAISFVILSTVVLQFFMTVFSFIRGGSLRTVSARTKYCIGLFLVSINIFSAQLWAETCKKFSPIEYVENTYIREEGEDASDPVYLPEVLMDARTREKSEDDFGRVAVNMEEGYGTFPKRGEVSFEEEEEE